MSVFEVRGGNDRRSMIKRYERKSKQDAIRELVDLIHCNWSQIEQLEARPAVAVPDGYALVPFHPTPEMVRAAEEAHMPFGDMDIALRMAILAAAPAQPAAPERVSVPRELLERITRRFSIRPHWDSMQQGAAIAELRALLAAQPQASAAQYAPSTGIYSSDPLACPGCAKGCFRCRPVGQSAPAGEREAFRSAVLAKYPNTTFQVKHDGAYLGWIDDAFWGFQAGASWQRKQSAGAPAGEREAPDGKLLVSAEPLRRVLNALVNAPHQIRELQATREPVALFADNPINILIAEYNAAHGGDE